MFGPLAAEQMVTQAIQTCWMMLPNEKRTIEHLEQEIRRIVERKIRDMREDAQSFGIS